MKRISFLFFALIYCKRDGTGTTGNTSIIPTPAPLVSILAREDESYNGSMKSSTSLPPSTSTNDSLVQNNLLDDISIRDILSSNTEANDKIEREIMNAISEFSLNCNYFNRIELSLTRFLFENTFLNVDLGIGTASFYNFVFKEESDKTNNNKRKSYSTLFGCDSSRIAKVEITFPNNIQITAKVKVEDTMSDSPNGLVSKSISEGSISITFKNNSILNQFAFQSNGSKYENDETRKFAYFQTEVSLDLDPKYQKVIYTNLGELLNKVESSLGEFFVDELNTKLTEKGILVGQRCSKYIDVEINPKKINSSFTKNDSNHLYVLHNVSQETWKGAMLTAGPIVIQGLYHFNTAEITVSGNELRYMDEFGFHFTTPSPDDPEKKQITVRIKTNGLKGKLSWIYNFQPRSFSFIVDFIMFEVKKIKNYPYVDTRSLYGAQYNGFKRTEKKNIDINVYVGNIQIKSSKFSVCENEKEFVNFVLSEYLKTVLKNSLKNSLVEKFQNNTSVVLC